MLPNQARTVLIVEDDPGIAALETMQLERAGYVVLTAGTAGEALERLRNHALDLVLLDYRLPDNVDGLEFHVQMKQAGFDLPVILVTGFSNEALAIQALRAGVRDFVTKSTEYLDYLPEAVNRVLKQTQTEQQLAVERSLLRTLIDALPDVVFTKDAAGLFVICNPAGLHLAGFTREAEIAGKTVFDLYPRELADLYHADDLSVLAGQPMYNHEEPCVNAAGQQRWYLTVKVPLVDRTGAITGLVGISKDITESKLREQERKRAEEELRASEERFRQVAENIREVFWLSDPVNSKILYVSPAYEAIWGRTTESLYRSPGDWLEAIHPDDRERVRRGYFAEGLAGTYDEVYRIIRPDNAIRWVHDRGFPVRDATGRVYRIAGVAEDITERKQLEEQFRHSQKMEAVGRLAGGVAHDFNNLLTVITGYSELMLAQLRPADPLHGFVEQVRLAGERAAGLTRQLLTFSRKQILKPVSLDLNVLFKEMEKMLRRLIGEDIDLLVSPHAPLWQVRADAGQIEQVVMNLVVNARDAMPKGGKLTIESGNVELDNSYVSRHPEVLPGKYVQLAVSDTGCGMDAATQARIFEPFFSTKGEKGTGLGLATVYGIVKQSGGSIDVYSEPGVGTSFKIYLPREQAKQVQSKSVAGIKMSVRGTETVLLAEDEPGVRSLAKFVLESNGYTVLEAKNGGEALLLCEQFKGTIHLLATDVIMPQMSGPQLAGRLARLQPGMKVLYLSGYTDDAIVHHGVLDPDTPFLQKPFSPQALRSKVREVLDQPVAAPPQTSQDDATENSGTTPIRILLVDDHLDPASAAHPQDSSKTLRRRGGGGSRGRS